MERRHINFVQPTEDDEAPYAGDETGRGQHRSRLFSCFLIALLFFAGCGIYKIIPSYTGSNDPSAYDPVTLEPKAPESFMKRLTQFVFHKDKVLSGEKSDRINILLLGMGGPGHDGPYLTDTIMIASIKPSTGQIAMISIPRDLGVKIQGHGWNKINNANSYGETQKAGWGAAFATEVVEETFNIDIQYYVRVDFKAFKEMIDEVGGITVNVDRAFTDPLFPAANSLYQTVSFSAGPQAMDGQTALEYARSRHGNNGEGSDFARAARQQKVILALKEKVLSFETLTNPVRINSIMKALDSNVTTNLEFSDIIEFIKLARSLNSNNIIRLVLDSSAQGDLVNGTTAEGAFILSPKTGNFDSINEKIATIFSNTDSATRNDTPSQEVPTLSPAMIEVQNGTWQAGMASRIKKRLDDQGVLVTTVGNTIERPQAQSGIYTLTDNKPEDVISSISSILSIPQKFGLPSGVTAATGTDILVILGDDFVE